MIPIRYYIVCFHVFNNWMQTDTHSDEQSSMEIAALNERLRDAFAPVIKHLAHLERLRLPPHPPVPAVMLTVRAAVGVASHGQPLPAPPAAPPSGSVPAAAAPGNALQFRAHCLTVLKRLNTYQYGTRAAFVRDLQQLEQLAGDADADAVRLLQVSSTRPDRPSCL